MAEKSRIIHGRFYEHPEQDETFGIFVTKQRLTPSEWATLQDRAHVLSKAHARSIRAEHIKPSLIVRPTSDQWCFAVLINRNPARPTFEALVVELLSGYNLEATWFVSRPGDEELLWAMLIWEMLQPD